MAFCQQVTDVLLEADLSGGTISNYIYKTRGRSNIAHCFIALDYGIFGDKESIEASLSKFMQEICDSALADGCQRIYLHGEKEAESRVRVLKEVVLLNEKIYSKLQMIGEYTGASSHLPVCLD